MMNKNFGEHIDNPGLEQEGKPELAPAEPIKDHKFTSELHEWLKLKEPIGTTGGGYPQYREYKALSSYPVTNWLGPEAERYKSCPHSDGQKYKCFLCTMEYAPTDLKVARISSCRVS